VIHCHLRESGTSHPCGNLKTHSYWSVLKFRVNSCLTVALAWDSGDGLVEGLCVCCAGTEQTKKGCELMMRS